MCMHLYKSQMMLFQLQRVLMYVHRWMHEGEVCNFPSTWDANCILKCNKLGVVVFLVVEALL